MQRDSDLDYIYLKLRKLVKKRFGVDLTTDKIHDIASSQFEILPKVMKEQDVLKLDKLGKFLIKPSKAEYLNKLTEEKDKP